MTTTNLLITGPIRPNVQYVNHLINRFKMIIKNNTRVFLCCWKDDNIDESMLQNVDHLFIEEEPTDESVFKSITERMIQQRQMHPRLEHWTPRHYKMFYGFRKIVETIDNSSFISDSDVVLRIRTDLYIDHCNVETFNSLLNNINQNVIYNRIRKHPCDWFSISTYNIFKKIWFIKDDAEYNSTIKEIFNPEGIVTYKSQINGINVVDIANTIKLCICREYINEHNNKLQYYDAYNFGAIQDNIGFSDLTTPFTDTQKVNSFLYLQQFMLDKMKKKETFFIGRLSGNECNLSGRMLSNTDIPQSLLNEMLTTAGIQFLSNDDRKHYVRQYTKACRNSSILCIWSGSMFLQAKPFYDLLYKLNNKQSRICAQALEPFLFMEQPQYRFDQVLKNKKVLIITSHKETAKKQLEHHNSIFNKPIFDESSEFYIYKPCQQNGGNHDSNSWIFHFEKMRKELLELQNVFDFDIALLGCGGFGMILSDFIFSEMNKSVMYVGGGLQLYFGIFGNRWRTHPIISKLFNDKWRDVLDEDKPKTISNARVCENNCYW